MASSTGSSPGRRPDGFIDCIVPVQREDRFHVVRKAMIYKPEVDDPYAMWQQKPQMQYKSKGHREGFRYPAPGSEAPPREVPRVTDENPYYSVHHFVRDPRNFKPEDVVEANSIYGPLKIQETQYRGGSKGQNIPAVFRYDPTGLAATSTATWAALDKELEKVKPDHLPLSMGSPEEWEDMREANRTKGRPMAVGPTYRWKKSSANYNVVRW